MFKGFKGYMLVVLLFFCFVSIFYSKDGFTKLLKIKTDKIVINKGSITVDGIKRTYKIHVPKGENLPLIIVLHGAGGNAQSAIETAQIDGLAEEKKFIVVYPNGTGVFREFLLSWNAGGCCNFVEPLGVDDVKFIDFLIDDLEMKYDIDPNRIYTAGISNGGMMAHRLGCDLTDRFAGIASVSSSMLLDRCEPSDFLSVITFHNLDDPVIPFDGGESSKWVVKLFKLSFNPEKDAVSFWVNHNSCNSSPQKNQNNGVYWEKYSGCKQGTGVISYVDREGGHSWPGGDRTWALGAKPAGNIVASEIIWDFFEKHYKK